MWAAEGRRPRSLGDIKGGLSSHPFFLAVPASGALTPALRFPVKTVNWVSPHSQFQLLGPLGLGGEVPCPLSLGTGILNLSGGRLLS